MCSSDLEKVTFKVFPSCSSDLSFVVPAGLGDGGQVRLSGLGMANRDLVVKVWYSLPSNISRSDREVIARAIRDAKPETG